MFRPRTASRTVFLLLNRSVTDLPYEIEEKLDKHSKRASKFTPTLLNLTFDDVTNFKRNVHTKKEDLIDTLKNCETISGCSRVARNWAMVWEASEMVRNIVMDRCYLF